MKKLFKKGGFWLAVLIVLTGILIYFIFFTSWVEIPGEKPEEIPEEFKGDKFEPASQIKSPISGSWQKMDFWVETLDEDLDSGLDPDSCQYKVLSYTPDGQEHASGWQERVCNSLSWVGAGEGKWCRFEGKGACWVLLSSKDRAANQHLPAVEKGSVKYYHIDWTSPEVGEILIEEEKVKARVSDNFKVTGCNLYLDDENLEKMSFLVPGCEKECIASKQLSVELESGVHQIFVTCQDAAGNYGRSKDFLIKENTPPEIFSCSITPTRGSSQTKFQFKVEVRDSDKDSLTFFWDFGDGESSNEQNLFHKYLNPGTFEPKVRVFDSRGGEAFCSTAWVVVVEE